VALGVFLIAVKAEFELVDPNLGEPDGGFVGELSCA
jgi:hypothetical protein